MSSTNANTNGVPNGTNGISPKIILYTNHGCPFAHRAHIALKELGSPYEEVIIDLDKPREPWYLEINPRGLVPSIKYSNRILSDEIITESAIVAQFLADSFPSHSSPASHSSPTAASTRARIAFFTDTWNTKVQSYMYPIFKAEGAEKEEQVDACVAAIEKEIEPSLAEAKPFFGGSEKLTLAEAIVAPFSSRFYACSNGDLMPESFKKRMQKSPNFGKWADQVSSQESVSYIWDEEKVISRTTQRIAKMKQAAK